MGRALSFIHAADLHLDSPFTGLSDIPERMFKDIRQSTFQALDRLIQVAIERQVDFVLLVGDLFEHHQQSIKAQVHLREAFNRLKQEGIQVYVSYGNHDYLRGNPFKITFPENVHVFPSEKVSSFYFQKDAQTLAKIYGFSYEEQSLTQNKAMEFKRTETDIPFHIAMLHGSLESNTEHDTYAPFQMRDLTSEGFDYWALGHIHRRAILKENPWIVYPGNIQGRHRKETGEKGCYYVTMTERETSLQFIPLQSVLFYDEEIDVSSYNNLLAFEHLLYDLKKQLKTSVPQLLYLSFINADQTFLDWERHGMIQEFIDIANDTEQQTGESWQYIYRYNVIPFKKVSKNKSITENHYFLNELIRQYDALDVSESIHELWKHPLGRKFLEPLSEDDFEMLKKMAYERIFSEFISHGRRS